ncbi:MAG: hypothetical protein ACT4P7_13140 [Gemmatimonadaceae bacterium]
MTSSDTRSATPPVSSSPHIVCLSTNADAADVLQGTVQRIVPDARVESADPSVLRDSPRSDCVILAVGSMNASSEPLVRELRARGYVNAIIVVADGPDMLPVRALELLGVERTLATGNLALALPVCLSEVLGSQERIQQSESGRRILASLRRLQTVIAAGQLAARLQHRLNNPLAALLAEAQLLELEALTPDHTTSVRRIIELCRRVIDETRSIEGLANAGGSPQ